MVIFSAVFALFLISLSAFIGSALRTPKIAIWALLIAAFCLEASAVASIGVGLFGIAPLSSWSQLILASCGSLSVFVFGLTLWNLWVQVQEGHLDHAEHDVLTGLLNRRGFMRRFGLSVRHNGTLAVVDVNRLKLINDQFGHTAGDQQIQQVSAALESVSQPPALLARWGGDEFVVFLEFDLAHSTQVMKILQEQHPSLLPGQPAFDFGLVAVHPEESFEKSFALADHELYLAKGDGAASAAALGEDQGLYEFGQSLAKLDSPEAVLRQGLHLIRTYLNFDLVVYSEIDGEQGDVLRSEGDGMRGVADRVAQELTGTIAPLPPFSRRVIRERRTQISVDYPNEPEADPKFVELGLKTVITSPVFHREEVVGLLTLMHFSNWKALPLNAVRITELATTRLSHALEMHTAIANIRRTLEGSLLALGVALEARDLETHGHTERVVQMSTLLGQTMGLSREDLQALRQGAYLHDIGKLAIPDSILLKPGRLDPEEWRVMQTHVRQGAELIRRIPEIDIQVLDVVLHHHERWDGGGYPSGLVGEAIPLVARLFAICDVYDALTSTRPYKAAWSRDDARHELQVQAGKQFDPLAVEVFLNLEF